MATFGKYGIPAAASSDAPVVPTTATVGLQTMMTRQDGRGRDVWPEERVSLDEALRGVHRQWRLRVVRGKHQRPPATRDAG